MLIECPECNLPVSDKAIDCPHCGYPLRPDPTQTKRKKPNRRRRLPNGFGQISEIKNRNLRKPFRAMVTVGKNINGRPICKPLKPEAYFATYNEAYAALVEYNRNPYDLSENITMAELYEKWFNEHSSKISDSCRRTYKWVWEYCSPLYDMSVTDVRARHIKGCIENGTVIRNNKEYKIPANAAKIIKSMFNQLLDYAVEYEIVEKNYAKTFTLTNKSNKAQKPHIVFTDEEIKLLWDNVNALPHVDMILIQCYSGWRPQELCTLEIENINMTEHSFRGGMKTDAGTDRLVPIHSKVYPLVERYYEQAKRIGSKYLFCEEDGGPIDYKRYTKYMSTAIQTLRLNENHRPHDGRKHFVTAAKKYKVDDFAIKYMVGHAIDDITEKVYTERQFEWLKTEIEKIK